MRDRKALHNFLDGNTNRLMRRMDRAQHRPYPSRDEIRKLFLSSPPWLHLRGSHPVRLCGSLSPTDRWSEPKKSILGKRTMPSSASRWHLMCNQSAQMERG